jgi:hypothetical protein
VDRDSNPATPCTTADPAPSSSSKSATYAVIGVLLAAAALALVAAVVLIRARRRRWLEENRPFVFDMILDELRASGLVGDRLALDSRPRELKRGTVSMISRLGEGAFGEVYKGLIKDQNAPEYTVAIKTLHADSSSAEKTDFMREAALMAQLKHPNVLSIVGVVTVGQPLLLVLQYCEHGSLNAFLKRHIGFQALQIASKYSIMLDIARGMTYLAGKHVVHRDLATRNVLVGADFACKIADFGLSREIETGSADYYASGRGLIPLRWTAPEAISSRHFSTATDVWAFGVLCGEVFDDGAEVCQCLCMSVFRVWR